MVDQVEIEKRIARLNEKLKFVNETWQKAGDRESMKFVVELGPKLFSCERLSIFVLDPLDDNVWVAWGTGLQERQIMVPKSSSLVGQVIHGKRLLSKTNMESQAGAHEKTDNQTGFISRNAMCTPIFDTKGDKVIGAIEILNKRGAGEFDDEDKSYLKKVALHLSRQIEGLYQRQELVKISREIEAKITELQQML